MLTVNGSTFENSELAHEAISTASSEGVVEFTYTRAGEEMTSELEPAYLAEIERDGVGVSLIETGIVKYPWYLIPVKGIEATISFTWQILVAFAFIVKSLLSSGSAPVDIAGPIGIAVITGQVAQQGIVYLLQFAAILSINLAIINALPFPALDGGRIVFVLLEGIRKKPLNTHVETIIHNLGFLLLMLLIIVVTYKDIVNLF